MRIAERIPWHPICLGGGYVALFWVNAAVSPFAGIRSLLVTLLAIAACQLLLTLLIRDARRAALVTTALLLVLASKTVFMAVGDAPEAMGTGLAALWLALISMAAILVGRIVWRRAREWTLEGATYVLNVFSAVFIVVVIVSAVIQGRVGMIIDDLDQGHPWTESATPISRTGDQSGLPDIYVLLLDGYAGAKALERVYGFDNAPFVDALERRGFETASASRSDYLWTHLTLMSMFHRDYLERVPGVDPLRRPGAPLHPLVRQLINDNPSFDDLRAKGYAIYATVIPIEQYVMRKADFLIEGGHVNDIEVELLAATFAGDVLNVARPEFAAGEHRSEILEDLAALPVIAAEGHGSPRFVFAHVMSPHHPVVWDADGSPVNPSLVDSFYADTFIQQGVSEQQFIDDYVGQIEHLNELVLETLDELAAASDPSSPPVIILMSDHGSAMGIDPDHAETGDVDERTSNFFAALTPGRESVFPEDITPVNIMRLLEDAYLGTEFGEVEPLAEGLHISPDELGE
jgi:hypothetical protein